MESSLSSSASVDDVQLQPVPTTDATPVYRDIDAALDDPKGGVAGGAADGAAADEDDGEVLLRSRGDSHFGEVPFSLEMESEQHKSNIPRAVANYTNAIVGAGIIGLPFALSEAGFLMGLILLIGTAYTTDYSVGLIIRAGRLTGTDSYEALCHRTFGKAGLYVIMGAMFSFAFGAMCAYTVIIGDTIPSVMSAWGADGTLLANRQFMIFVTLSTVMLPLSSLRNVDSLAKTSFASLLAVVLIVLIVIIRGMARLHDPADETGSADFSLFSGNFFQAVAVISLAMVCHHNTFLLYRTLRKNSLRRFKLVTHLAVSIATVFCILLAVFGYVAFRDDTKGNILNNFAQDDGAIAFARLLLAVTMFFTYPIELFVCRDVIHGVIGLWRPGTPLAARLPTSYHLGITGVLVVLTMAIGMATSNLGVVLELTGGFSAVVLGFIGPGAVYAKAASGAMLSRKKIPPILLSVFGVVVMVSSTTLTIRAIATGTQRGE